jgi:hypothetical protein
MLILIKSSSYHRTNRNNKSWNFLFALPFLVSNQKENLHEIELVRFGRIFVCTAVGSQKVLLGSGAKSDNLRDKFKFRRKLV